MRLLLAALSLAGLVAVHAQDQCYYAAGKEAPEKYIPCSSGGGVAACCQAGDYCLEDGACFSPGTQMTYIAGCTDSTFQDDNCRGGDTCKKSTPFQGIANCGTSWVCCGGEGQTGIYPANGYSGTCPCSDGFGTALIGPSSLPAVNSLGTAFPTRASSTSSAAPTTSHSSKPASSSSGADSTSTTATPAPATSSAPKTTLSISINPNAGIHATGAGSSASPTSSSSSSGGGGAAPSNTSLKVGLGVGIPLGLLAIAGVGAALYFFRNKLLKREPQYVTQADMSTPVWMGEAPGSGLPAPQENGWKERSSGTFGQGAADAASTPPPQYPR